MSSIATKMMQASAGSRKKLTYLGNLPLKEWTYPNISTNYSLLDQTSLGYYLEPDDYIFISVFYRMNNSFSAETQGGYPKVSATVGYTASSGSIYNGNLSLYSGFYTGQSFATIYYNVTTSNSGSSAIVSAFRNVDATTPFSGVLTVTQTGNPNWDPPRVTLLRPESMYFFSVGATNSFSGSYWGGGITTDFTDYHQSYTTYSGNPTTSRAVGFASEVSSPYNPSAWNGKSVSSGASASYGYGLSVNEAQ